VAIVVSGIARVVSTTKITAGSVERIVFFMAFPSVRK